MNISFTDNITLTLLDAIKPAILSARELKFAVAFMKYSGYALIEQELRACLEKNAKIEFLLGLDFQTTEPKVLKILNRLSLDNSQLKCYCFRDISFKDASIYHPKLYLLNNEKEVIISLGSSNLTGGGLRDNIEANAIIKADIKEEIVSDIYGLYNRLKFQQDRFEPDIKYIENYEEAYNRIRKRNREAFEEESTQKLLEGLVNQEKDLPKPISISPELFGWQKIVYEKLPLGKFRTSDIYRFEDEFRKYYPGNRNICAKIRQILQQLRDIRLIENPGRDSWVRHARR